MTDLPIPHPYWLQTYGGHAFDFMNPKPEALRIEVIAHHLSRICRYVGAPREHYSVAQHCVHVSELVPRDIARQALLHDGHEFIFGDTAGPVLRLLRHHVNGAATALDFYRDLLDRSIAKAFSLEFPIMTPVIARADALMLAAEKRDLLDPEPQSWGKIPTPAEVRHIGEIVPWPAEVAKARFLETFDAAGGVR